MSYACYLIEPTGKDFILLRRSTRADGLDARICLSPSHPYQSKDHHVGHTAYARGDDVEMPRMVGGSTEAWNHKMEELRAEYPLTSVRWPLTCRYCDYAFEPGLFTDSVDTQRMYRKAGTQEVGILPGHIDLGLPAFVVGAMWFSTWDVDDNNKHFCYAGWTNCDGRHLEVQTPGGTWDIDSRCSNCTMKQDTTHRCWVRHGVPPMITVDKAGVTCQAGAGSILCGSYHGFLQNGSLT